MNRRLLPTALLLLSTTTFAGCGDDEPVSDPASSASTTATPTTTTPTDTAPTPTDTAPSDTAPTAPALVIRPGAIGDARVGMTRSEWGTTGLFADGPAICEGELIHWKDAPDDIGLRVATDADATITQLWATAPGPATEHGNLQVGSTYGELRAAFPDITEPVADGWDQASVYPPGEENGLPYLGFLLAAPPDEVDDATPISAIAATDGEPANFQIDC